MSDEKPDVRVTCDETRQAAILEAAMRRAFAKIEAFWQEELRRLLPPDEPFIITGG